MSVVNEMISAVASACEVFVQQEKEKRDKFVADINQAKASSSPLPSVLATFPSFRACIATAGVSSLCADVTFREIITSARKSLSLTGDTSTPATK